MQIFLLCLFSYKRFRVPLQEMELRRHHIAISVNNLAYMCTGRGASSTFWQSFMITILLILIKSQHFKREGTESCVVAQSYFSTENMRQEDLEFKGRWPRPPGTPPNLKQNKNYINDYSGCSLRSFIAYIGLKLYLNKSIQIQKVAQGKTYRLNQT